MLRWARSSARGLYRRRGWKRTFKLSQDKFEADRSGVMARLGDSAIVPMMCAAIPPR